MTLKTTPSAGLAGREKYFLRIAGGLCEQPAIPSSRRPVNAGPSAPGGGGRRAQPRSASSPASLGLVIPRRQGRPSFRRRRKALPWLRRAGGRRHARIAVPAASAILLPSRPGRWRHDFGRLPDGVRRAVGHHCTVTVLLTVSPLARLSTVTVQTPGASLTAGCSVRSSAPLTAAW